MGEGELYIEKRKHKRIDKKYKVNYRLILGEDEAREIKKSSVRDTGTSSDISLGGVRVEGEVSGSPEDIVRLEINPGDGSDPITTFAEIKWVRDGEGGVKTFGLEFLILKESDKGVISGIIEDD